MELTQVSEAGHACFLWDLPERAGRATGLSCCAALGHFTATLPWKWHATAISIQRQADFQTSNPAQVGVLPLQRITTTITAPADLAQPQ